MSDKTTDNTAIEYRDYGIDEYVPQEARYYGFKEMMSTWTCANANPTSWYMGSTMGAMGLSGALIASFTGNPVIYLILALVGIMGFRVASSTMGLARVPFGIVGSKLPSLINAIQFIGWCGVNTYIAAMPLSSLLSSFLGTDPYSNTMIIISVLIILGITAAIAITGGARWIGIAQNIAVVCLVALSVWITYSIFTTISLSEINAWRLMDNPLNAGWEMSFGNAFDYLAAFGFAWIMAVADYTRYTKTKSAATVAPLVGASFGMIWFCIIGAVSAIAVAVINGGIFDPNTADLGYICSMLGMGQIANVLIVISTVAVNMINVYSGGFSTANVTEKIEPKISMMIISIGAALLALTPLFVGTFLDTFQVFLGYLGSVFPPCIAIMVVDYFIIRKGNYDITQFSKVDGIYWYSNGINWKAVISWFVGVGGFFLAQKIPFIANSIGAVFFCFVLSGVLYGLTASAKKA